MTAPPPGEDDRILALRREAQRRLEVEDRERQLAADDPAAELREHARAVANEIEQAAPMTDLLANEFEVRDAQAEARYQRRSYTFLGLSILMLTFFVGYGARGLLLQSLTVSLLLLISAFAGVWSLFLGFEKYKRGMILAEHIADVNALEQSELNKIAAVEADRPARAKSVSGRSAASRTKTSGSKATHIHFGHKSGTRTGRTQNRAK